MTKKKVCKKCRMLLEGNECPICKSNQVTDSWNGRIYIIDPNKSRIAKEIGATVKGEYAIKTR